jgi:hypothetical protein
VPVATHELLLHGVRDMYACALEIGGPFSIGSVHTASHVLHGDVQRDTW